MTPDEEQQLRELGEELAGAQQSEWQPRCIAEAWRSPVDGAIALTMQGWIDLDAARSPMLRGEVPDQVAEFEVCARAFGVVTERMEGVEMARTAMTMRDAVAAAFRAALKMVPADPQLAPADAQASDGFGDWLPMLTFLVKECGLHLDEALALRVDRAFMIMAAVRRNQGWRVAGMNYALRDAEAE